MNMNDAYAIYTYPRRAPIDSTSSLTHMNLDIATWALFYTFLKTECWPVTFAVSLCIFIASTLLLPPHVTSYAILAACAVCVIGIYAYWRMIITACDEPTDDPIDLRGLAVARAMLDIEVRAEMVLNGHFDTADAELISTLA